MQLIRSTKGIEGKFNSPCLKVANSAHGHDQKYNDYFYIRNSVDRCDTVSCLIRTSAITLTFGETTRRRVDRRDKDNGRSSSKQQKVNERVEIRIGHKNHVSGGNMHILGFIVEFILFKEMIQDMPLAFTAPSGHRRLLIDYGFVEG